ncbi:hypothetical protein HHI36_001691 [Cryptolaemus montrouzieri]|uniref:Uncharacterized protein n=1 Tax=Cryptolaemus montrouzieri TaxID=559131 RepID=A0ABD2P8Q4_9CUCU
MVQQIKSSYQESRSSKFKQILGRAISGKIVKNTGNYLLLGKILSLLFRQKFIGEEYVKCKNVKSNQKFIQDRVTSFYEENSKIIPDKNASIKINGKQVTKRYMNATMKDLQSKFCSQRQAIKHFNHELDLFIAHEYRITHQNNSMKKLTQSLESNELGLLIDFSENYSCKYETEVQPVH